MGKTMLIVGHGGFDTSSEMILVPKGTSITFLSDGGSALSIPSKYVGPPDEYDLHKDDPEGQYWAFDYQKVTNVLDQYLQAEKPKGELDPLPNMSLSKLGAKSQKTIDDLYDNGKLPGIDLVQSTPDSAWLCDGDGSTCPTPWLLKADERHQKLTAMGAEEVAKMKAWVDQGATLPMPAGFEEFEPPALCDFPDLYYGYLLNGVPADRWYHNCTGLFEKADVDGWDIIWLSCTSFVATPDELAAIGLPQGLPPEMTRSTDAPPLDPAPSKADLDRYAALNAQKFKDLPEGNTIRLRVAGDMVLLGDDHEGNAESYFKHSDKAAEGTLLKKKSGAFTKGSLQVDGIPSANKETVKAALKALAPDRRVIPD